MWQARERVGLGWGGVVVGAPVLTVCAKTDEYPRSERQCCRGRKRVVVVVVWDGVGRR